jgi:Ser/Thr protein kinase RdoA (MazF antagonist)
MSPTEQDLQVAAHRVLAAWDIDLVDVELISHSENVVFKITDSGSQCYVLRLHRPGYNTLAELESELAWTDHLAGAGVACPAHVLTRAGQGYAQTPGIRDCYAGLIRWLPGESLAERFTDLETISHCYTHLGELIAKTHNVTAAWRPPDGFIRRRWDAEGLMGTNPLWGRFWEAPDLPGEQREVLSRARPLVYEHLLNLGEGADFFGLIHADLHPRNVLVHGQTIQVIDFDDAGFGWHHYDIAVALGDALTQQWYSVAEDAMFEGYARERAGGDKLKTDLAWFFLTRSLVSIGWLSARPELGLQDHLPLQAERALKQIDDLLGLTAG